MRIAKRHLQLMASVATILIGLAIIGFVGWYGYIWLNAGNDSEDFIVELSPEREEVVLGHVLETYSTDSLVNLYPASRINPKYWGASDDIEDVPFGGPTIPDGFEPVEAGKWELSKDESGDTSIAATPSGNSRRINTEQSSSDDSPSDLNTSPLVPTVPPAVIPSPRDIVSPNENTIDLQDATRIRIPAIGLDSSVSTLNLIDLGDAQQYETPKNTVGFIPETSPPGGGGSGWYFGHLESFGHDEGSVFRNLPNIAEMIKKDPVDIFVTTEDGEFLYRVTRTTQVSAEDLALVDYGPDTITLCTCWPPKVYSERILVTAELIAFKKVA